MQLFLKCSGDSKEQTDLPLKGWMPYIMLYVFNGMSDGAIGVVGSIPGHDTCALEQDT